ncbi:glycosyltransferase family 1 protein [Psychroserpens sp.]|uniref:glycosyltransferase family 4 protein n=1 Tax=Psychroserpens sp. TaxID=2020870 RepID=UPI001B28A287|nr:glycosyltransferase family 1 protein [Psychroserpens sp.]MBO6605714.1 glycosyltransferase family 4 protein [Psychroserpens sp.]MBO6630294.1 glycosyltransferase family 4 protein [Psychroserpens sp.]MBO6652915.1 glycosyltransferase family 4 protein [Psychroserpens sp.]MBO6681313.1 glycosyltransferase family 4 protein [Psychroserpens sp.]MBO6749088.1 glycosyltransferase family 4 protein [Psychroserpens sp.]
MRIGIEAQRLFRPHKHGMDRVALELIKNLQKLDTLNEYFIFVKPDQDNQIIKETSNFKIVEIPGGSYPIWEQFKLPRVAQKYKCDILHCTSNTAPMYQSIPLVTTLHDVIFSETSMIKQILSSASWYQKLGNIYRRLIVNRVIKRSAQLITVSNFEKQNIKDRYRISTDKIETVYNGVNSDFSAKIDSIKQERVVKKYKLPELFLLHIGNTDPRKNTSRVLEAFNEFIDCSSESYKLVLVGLNEDKLDALLNDLGLTKLKQHIVLTGYVSDEDLPVIFSMAKVFLFPSLREGFGIPIIEAMASGIPVITSNTSSMPEVAGEAACIVDPYCKDDILLGITNILTNDQLRLELVKKGLTRSNAFSWMNSATSVLELYQQLYEVKNK